MDISDRFCDVAHTFLVAIGQKHPGSLDCEGATNCGTQALCRTSHQRPFSGKPLSHHFVSFFAQADCFERPSVTRPFDALIQSQSGGRQIRRSEEHTSELQSLMRISYAVFCLKKNTSTTIYTHRTI